MRLLAALLLAIFTSEPGPARSAPGGCEAAVLRAADRYGVPAGILYAVGLAETGRRGSMSATALNIGGRAVFPASRAEAERVAAAAIAAGAAQVDIGCMQINHHWHGQAFPSLEAMFDPAGNVDYAARFLAALERREGSWSLAVARYHAGPDNDPAQKTYVCRVIANLAATGFGRWTPAARDFCR